MLNKQIDIKDIQVLELQMMKFFHELCQKNSLTYSLGFGSCLGAIRHDGFIPWDDDIDIIMPYSDYIKLIQVCSKNGGRYELYCFETDESCTITFAKLIDTYTELNEIETSTKPIGVYIDIFPVYNLPTNKFAFKYYIYRLKLLDCLTSCARKNNFKGKTFFRTLVQYIIGPFAKKIGTRYFISKSLDIIRSYSNKELSSVIAYMPATKGERECFPRNMLSDLIYHKFEDTEFYVPKDYDDYLRINYGEYMELPPLEKRNTHHKYTVRLLKGEKL